MFANELQRQTMIAFHAPFPTCGRCGEKAEFHGGEMPRDGDIGPGCGGYDALFFPGIFDPEGVCQFCGAPEEKFGDSAEMPSMAGYGCDGYERCRRCGQTYTWHPDVR